MIRSLNRLQPWALMLLRITLGASLAYNGWDKIIPSDGFHRAHPLAGFDHFNHYVTTLGLPYWLGYVSTLTEFLGGIFVCVGFLTRFWAFLIFGNMLVALWKVNIHHGYEGSQYTLALIVMALMLVAAGSGALSVDRRLGIS